MNTQHSTHRRRRILQVLSLGTIMTLAGLVPTPARADHLPAPGSVSVPGNFQSELGCPGDWQPECANTDLVFDTASGMWVGTFNIPAGNWHYKIAINDSWDENYGAGGAQNGPDIALDLAQPSMVTFTYDPDTHEISDNAPRTAGNLDLAQAYWLDWETIAWNVPMDATVTLHHDPDGNLALGPGGVSGGQEISLIYDAAGLEQAIKDKFPHLASLRAFKLDSADLALVPAILKGQMAVSAFDSGGMLLDATALQIPGVLDDLFTYGGDLGVIFRNGAPTLKLWAPTARTVTLHLFDDSDPATASTTYPMTEDPAAGVWSITGDRSWDRKYYLFEVEVFVRATGQVENNFVTDPYSFSLAMDSKRSQIVNLDDRDLQPAGWKHLRKPRLEAPEDIVIYELHVRDFSINDATVPENLRGTFGAFGLHESNGIRHLKRAARAGLTHVHLLPAFDIASVPENPADRMEPSADFLASQPPDSDQQQAAVEAVKDKDGFNWGYDPFHYTAPEGSYATDPDGVARIREFREMVQGLARSGLRVVMDVVYNHTTASGQGEKSVLDRVVPGYFHRLNGNGDIETSTCCSNTASEHAMMEKLMVDSLLTWARDYKVDGFRFDLMGHHTKANLLKIRDALQALTPRMDGVDGSRIYLYGEGWNFGEVANDARFVQAAQFNMGDTGIGTFNDRIRDAVRGGGPFDGGINHVINQGFINGLFYDPNAENLGGPGEFDRLLLSADRIRVGLAGNLADYTLVDRNGDTVIGAQVDYNGSPTGYVSDPQEVINYAAAHDNETLFDINLYKAPLGTSMDDRVRIQNMGISLVALGQGIPFFHAGQDMLRSKSMDRNSFNSGDWFNHLDFSYELNGFGRGLPPQGDNGFNRVVAGPLLANPDLVPARGHIVKAVQHFLEMLEIRKSSRLFRLRTADAVREQVKFHNTGPAQIPGLIVMSLSGNAVDPGIDCDSGLDRGIRQIVVLFNATTEAVSFTVNEFAGQRFRLHPVQRSSGDPVVRGARFNREGGTFTVPGRTTAVFIAVGRGDG